MPNRTEWMIAHSVTVTGTAKPNELKDEGGNGNAVAAVRIQRTSGVGAVIIEGRPDDLLRVAHEFLEQVQELDRATQDSPQLRSLYGRV